MTQRKVIYTIIAFAVIVGAWTYVLSEIYKYEMDTYYSMAPHRVSDVPQEAELNSEMLFARSLY